MPTKVVETSWAFSTLPVIRGHSLWDAQLSHGWPGMWSAVAVAVAASATATASTALAGSPELGRASLRFPLEFVPRTGSGGATLVRREGAVNPTRTFG